VLCNSKDVEFITSRKNVPVIQNGLFDNELSSKLVEKGNIELYQCRKCKLVFNKLFKAVCYDQRYENNQMYSSEFTEYVNGLKLRIVNFIKHIDGNVTIIEIGCGQGSFLDHVTRELASLDNWNAIGFDPAYREDPASKKRYKIYNEAFSGDYLEDECFENIIVIARHVVEYFTAPDFIFEGINKLWSIKNVYLFMETPDFDWILQNGAIEDIGYERGIFFTKKSIQYLLYKMGFDINFLKLTFNNQYMWIEAERITDDYVQIYQNKENAFIEKWQRFFEKTYEQHKKICIWGGGAKGVDFLNLFDPYQKFVSIVIDVNSQKHGHYLAGTGHLIAGIEYLESLNVDYIIVMNKNYLGEIEAMLDTISYKEKICVLLLE